MPVPFLLTSVLIASLLMTPLVQSACLEGDLSFNPAAPRGSRLALYCQYKEEQKPLFTTWVDLTSCARCFCKPSGLKCCTMYRHRDVARCSSD